jgi:tetratricopeptide (TPR) repeat protein
MVGENVAILSALGEAHFLLAHVTGEGIERIGEQADQIADRILRLDPSAAAGHFYRGLSAAKRPWGAPKAMQHFCRAAELNPNDSIALMFRAFWGAQTGCVEEGLRSSKAALELDPLSPGAHMSRSYCLMFAGELERAVEEAERGVSLDPMSTYHRLFLMAPLVQAGNRSRLEEVAAEFDPEAGDNWSRAAAFLDAALGGRPADSLPAPELLHAARHDETFSWMLAQCYAQLGRVDEALEWLENAISLGFSNPEFLGEGDVLLAPIRNEPRFGELLAEARRLREAVRRALPAHPQ